MLQHLHTAPSAPDDFNSMLHNDVPSHRQGQWINVTSPERSFLVSLFLPKILHMSAFHFLTLFSLVHICSTLCLHSLCGDDICVEHILIPFYIAFPSSLSFESEAVSISGMEDKVTVSHEFGRAHEKCAQA